MTLEAAKVSKADINLSLRWFGYLHDVFEFFYENFYFHFFPYLALILLFTLS